MFCSVFCFLFPRRLLSHLFPIYRSSWCSRRSGRDGRKRRQLRDHWTCTALTHTAFSQTFTPRRYRSHRRLRTEWTGCPGRRCHRCSCLLRRRSDCFDEHRDHLACTQRPLPMAHYAENRGDFSRMAGEAEPSVLVAAEHIIKHLLGAEVLCLWHFSRCSCPQIILLCEASFERKAGEVLFDPGLGGPSITGMFSHAFAQSFSDQRLERILLRQLEITECKFSGLEAALHRRAVVRLDERNLFLGIARLPVLASLLGLGDARLRDSGVGIDEGRVCAFQQRPVAVPCWCADIRLLVVVSIANSSAVGQILP